MKLRAKDTERQPIISVTEIFHGKSLWTSRMILWVVELTGGQDKLDAFLDLVEATGYWNWRDGITGLSRGCADVKIFDENGHLHPVDVRCP